MSVIFETLQKLKQGTDEPPEAISDPGRQRRSISLGRAFLPFGVVICVGVGLLVFLLWGSLGVLRVTDQRSRDRAVAGQDFKGVQTKQELPETSPDSPSEKYDVSLPPSPELKAVQATKGKLYLPMSVPKEGREKEMARYLPPTPVGMSSSPLVAKKEGFQYEAASENRGKGGKRTAEAELMNKSGQREQSKGAEPNPFEAPQKIAKIQDLSEPEIRPATPEQQRHTSEREKTGDEMRIALLTQETKEPMKHASPSRPKHLKTTAMHTVDRSAQMGLLVERLQQAVRGGDEKEVETLLERLESLKGRSDYVMRLKAFWYLKGGKYELARPLLQQLINKDENDLEAGINMAVLDIRTNHLEEARKRLRELRRLHGENTMIPAILEKINR